MVTFSLQRELLNEDVQLLAPLLAIALDPWAEARIRKLQRAARIFHHGIIEEDEIRVKLLEYAYIGGRYDPEYYISKDDLEILAKDVEKLLKVTKEVCEEKIKTLDTDMN